MIVSTILLLSVLYYLYNYFVEKRKKYPPGPLPLPFFGNILQPGASEQHKQMQKWSKEYGPVFTLWIGSDPNIVITDYQIMKNTLKGQGEIFAGRPDNFVFHDFRKGREYGIVVNDGAVWKQQRRFALHVLREFGFGRQLMEEKIMREVNKLIESVEKATKGPTEIGNSVIEAIELCVANVINSLLMGRSLDTEEKFRHLKFLVAQVSGVSSKPEMALLGQYPWLRHLPFIW